MTNGFVKSTIIILGSRSYMEAWNVCVFEGTCPCITVFFNFNTFWKLILNLTLSVFFKTNTFGRAYCHGAAKCLCRAMHGSAVGSWRGDDRKGSQLTWQGLPRHPSWHGSAAPGVMARLGQIKHRGLSCQPEQQACPPRSPPTRRYLDGLIGTRRADGGSYGKYCLT